MKFAEAFSLAMSVLGGPVTEEPVPLLRIPASMAAGNRVSVRAIITAEEGRAPSERTLDFPTATLGAWSSVETNYYDAAWKITPLLFRDDRLYRAVRFLVASQGEFFVWPGEVSGAIDAQGESATFARVQTRHENALQNAFKAVEAVIGEPPRDEGKLFAKIRAIGLDPEEKVGYTCKGRLCDKIRTMQAARDKRAAHGGNPHARTLTLGELLEYQSCAHYLVIAAMEQSLGQAVFD